MGLTTSLEILKTLKSCIYKEILLILLGKTVEDFRVESPKVKSENWFSSLSTDRIIRLLLFSSFNFNQFTNFSICCQNGGILQPVLFISF